MIICVPAVFSHLFPNDCFAQTYFGKVQYSHSVKIFTFQNCIETYKAVNLLFNSCDTWFSLVSEVDNNSNFYIYLLPLTRWCATKLNMKTRIINVCVFKLKFLASLSSKNKYCSEIINSVAKENMGDYSTMFEESVELHAIKLQFLFVIIIAEASGTPV
jgi:hypothetical protein